MSTCLTTRLDGVVSGSNLRTPSEFRIKVTRQSDYSSGRAWFWLNSIADQTVSIINETNGNNYFYDENNVNLGKTVDVVANVAKKIFCSNGTYEISIPNKYAIFNLDAGRFVTNPYKFFSFDVKELSYITTMNILLFAGTAMTGDIKYLAHNTTLHDITADATKLYGDIGSLKTLTNLQYCRFNYCSDIYGNISVAQYLPDLRGFEFLNCPNVYGNLSALANCLNLEWVQFPSTIGQGNITGDISALANHNKIIGFVCEDEPNVTGDISVFKTNTEYLQSLYFWRSSGVFGDIAELAPCMTMRGIRIGETSVTGNLGVFLADKPSLTYIDAQMTSISGDITNISIPAMTDFWISNSGVTGSIGKVESEGLTRNNEVVLPAHNAADGFVKHCPALIGFGCSNTQLEGDVDVFSNCPGLLNLQVYNSNVSGDISSLSTLEALQYVNIGESKIYGDVGTGFANCSDLRELWMENALFVGGDLSKLGPKTYLIISTANTGPFTWTTNRPSTSTIMAMLSVNFGEYLDAMLINQAACQPSGNGGFGDAYSINVRGTHSSDPAVKANAKTAILTLMNKGYSVLINGVLQTEATVNNI